MPSLQVSLVTCYPDEDDLIRCLHGLADAIEYARSEGIIHSVNIALIDNSRDQDSLRRQVELAGLFFREPIDIQYLHGHANVGLGGAYNLSLHGSGADYHLLLRVHTELHREALAEGVSWMQANDDTGLATAALFDPSDALIYPCLHYPTIFDVFLLYLAPRFLRRWFRKRLNAFEMVLPTSKQISFSNMSCVAGDCLLARRSVTDQSGGFDPRFFQYFGDFDLSLRLGLISGIVYLPEMRAIVHPSEDGSVERRPKYKYRFIRDAIAFIRKNNCRWW